MDKDTKGNSYIQTRVGLGILITGRIEGEGDVIVEGRVDGEIAIRGDLHIDQGGQVKADVKARNIFVRGILVGNAEAGEKLEVAEGGRMVGDARSPRMLLNEGALFRGMVDMVDFEVEERASEARPQTRRPVRAVTPAAQMRPTRPAARPGSAAFSSTRGGAGGARSESGGTESKSLYTPPPLPKPPEVAGVRKAIIIKKKSGADS